MEFVNAYNENIGRQNIEVLEANLLAQAIVKFVESWYDEGKKVCWERLYQGSVRTVKQNSTEYTKSILALKHGQKLLTI